jgi:ATP-dependent protease ClpP protease subunit
MPIWNEILNEIEKTTVPSSFDLVRREYLSKFSRYTGRNVILYYSGWLRRPGAPNTEINDADTTGFMSCIHNMNAESGLDLIIHTPGGNITACEHIVNYLKSKFGNDIRAFVPHMAMSAGTMLACACSEIFMGKHSCLGPVDPNIGGISAFNAIREFEAAQEQINAAQGVESLNKAINYWSLRLKDFSPTFILDCQNAVRLSKELTRGFLLTNMFEKHPDKETLAKKIEESLNEKTKSMDHSRHYNYEKCKEIGLNVSMIEENPVLQDLLLSTFHACTILVDRTTICKIIENQFGIGYFANA